MTVENNPIKKNLVAIAALAAVVLPNAAFAQTLSVTATDNGTALVFTPATSSPGVLDGTFADPNFSSISVSISGVPAVTSPDLGTVNLSATSTGGSHVLDIVATQSGLTNAAGFNGALTQTFNNLIGGPGPAVENFLVNGAVNISHTFPILPLGSDEAQFSLPNLPAITSNAEEFITTFNAAGQDAELTQEFTATPSIPEPASLTLLGSALVGLGWFARLRRKTV